MAEFKKGEKIAFYNNGRRFTGIIENIDPSEEVESIFVQGNWYHPKQCRKLKRKARREWWKVVLASHCKVLTWADFEPVNPPDCCHLCGCAPDEDGDCECN